MRIAIVGAGMAGLACAEKLASAGCEVSLFDKGRRAGGRMSTRRSATSHGPAAFDHGAQYMTARDPAFRARVARWREAGLVAPWPAAGEDAWVGVPAMDAPLAAMSASLAVRWDTRVERIAREVVGEGAETRAEVPATWRLQGERIDEGAFDTVVVAVPAEQAAALLAPCDAAMADRAAATPSQPCWTVMAAFAEPLPIAADIVRQAGAVGWAARDTAKPGRSGPESWVVQAAPDWSREHLELPAEEVADALMAAFYAAAGLDGRPALAVAAHRWRYARSGAAGDGPLWDAAARLGVCGDWLLGPRVECAWLSGDRLADLMLGAPSASSEAMGRRST